MDKIILSYHDACLYQSDLKILKSDTDWLNDRIISFYFEYLRQDVFQNDDVLFIGPEVTQAIKMMGNPDDVKAIFLDHLNTASRSHIIFAVNDNTSVDAGGSHWSLCTFFKKENTFFHFDSFNGANHHPCLSLVKILKSCFSCKDAPIVEIVCLQQTNCSDCGIFVLCHTDIVCQAIEKREPLAAIKKLQPNKVPTKRVELIEIIENLQETSKSD